MHSFNKIISMPILLLCLLGILGGSTEKVMVKKLEIVEQYTNFFRFGLETFEKKLESQDLKNVISIVPQMSKQAIFSPIFHGLFRHFGKVMVLVLRFSDFLKCFQPKEIFLKFHRILLRRSCTIICHQMVVFQVVLFRETLNFVVRVLNTEA